MVSGFSSLISGSRICANLRNLRMKKSSGFRVLESVKSVSLLGLVAATLCSSAFICGSMFFFSVVAVPPLGQNPKS